MTAPANGQTVVDLRDLAKTFRGRIRALRGVTMQVHRGEIFGLLGPNGAGKSTLVKILMTVVRPTHGRGRLLGRPIGDKAALAHVGYLPEHYDPPEYLTGAQVLDHFAALSRVPRRLRRTRAGELLDLVGLTRWERRSVRSYSKGMRQRLGVALALMNDPDLILLDEPTDGVDPVGRRDIRTILLRQRERGRTIFLNSHLLSELEMVCDRVAILVQGVVSRQGTLAELTLGRQRYDIGLAEPLTPAQLEQVRGSVPTNVPAESDPTRIRLATAEARAVQPVLDALRRAGAIIQQVVPVRPTLEDLFMEAVTDPHTGEPIPPGAEDRPRPKRRSASR